MRRWIAGLVGCCLVAIAAVGVFADGYETCWDHGREIEYCYFKETCTQCQSCCFILYYYECEPCCNQYGGPGDPYYNYCMYYDCYANWVNCRSWCEANYDDCPDPIM